MRVFSGSLATETNTFAPMPTGVADYRECCYYPAGQHPDTMQMYSGPLWAARQRGVGKNWTLLEGMVASATPGGITTRHAYESLRDELLDDLRAALPVDMVLLGMHGAMVADGYDDCEGDLLTRVREIAGSNAVIGGTLDPHCHLTEAMVSHADVLICWKEYPHTDILERALELVDLCVACKERRVQPVASVVDTGMISQIHTTREPARSFVDRIRALEGNDGILSISIAHGFPWGDVPGMGTKALVYTDVRADPDEKRGHALAQRLADELVSMREALNPPQTGIDDALVQALSAEGGAVVLADGADNSGGGAPGDSTFILRRLFELGIGNACLGPMWDPIAVRLAFVAGEGARLALRVGGKIGPASGAPIDAIWTVKALRADMVMTGLGGTPAPLGDCALIESAGVEVVLTTLRCQAFDIDLFTQLGCNPADRKLVIVKSSQHFYTSYSKIASQIIYVSAPGAVPDDLNSLPFRQIRRPKWPFER